MASAGKDRSLCIHADIRPQRPAGAAEEEAAFELVFQQKNAHKRIIWDCRYSSMSLNLYKWCVGCIWELALESITPSNWQFATLHKHLPASVLLLHSWSSNETLLATVGRDGACKIWTSRYSYSPEVTGESSLGCAPYSWTQLITFSSEDGAALTTVDFLPRGTSSLIQCPHWLALGTESGLISIWKIAPRMSHSIYEASCLLTLPTHFCHGIGTAVRRLRWSPVESPAIDSMCSRKLASCGDDHTLRIYDISIEVL